MSESGSGAGTGSGSETGSAGAAAPGIPSRRRFLSAGGLLASAGTLGLPAALLDAPRSGRPRTRRGAAQRDAAQRGAAQRDGAPSDAAPSNAAQPDAMAPAGLAAPDQSGLAPIYPPDPRYATMSMGFNQRWVGTPAYIQVVRSAAETVAAVQRAYDAGLRITARGGGHCYENFSAGEHGGVIIDLSGMQDVQPGPGRRGRCVAGRRHAVERVRDPVQGRQPDHPGRFLLFGRGGRARRGRRVRRAVPAARPDRGLPDRCGRGLRQRPGPRRAGPGQER